MKVIKKIFILSIILLTPLAIHTTSVQWINYDKIEKNLENWYKKNWNNYIKNIKKTISKILEKKNIKKEKKEILKKIEEILDKIISKSLSPESSLPFGEKGATKNKQEKNNKKNTKKINSENNLINKKRLDFYNKYGKNIISKKPISPLCLKKYDLIDSIAKKNDFPTELIIATWGMEHSCIFKNPSNWNWNFQIITRVYKPGKITDKQFAIQVQDFINFSKNKWKFWERYKKTKVHLKYNDYDFASIRYHAAAYNWIWNHLITSKYINWNLNLKVPYKKDWITTRFLKVLDWEIKNKKNWNTYSTSNYKSADNYKKVLGKSEFDKITFTKNWKNNFTVFWTTNWKLKYIKVLWLSWPKNEEYYKLQNYKYGNGFFIYNLKEKYENIKPWINKYKFVWENKYWKKFEKILEIKN